ncbi:MULTISPECIES: hypothetical protein [unclassified Modestobacter]|uniref:hypothetical protein n=1 Tax=unclassified Modestobacter TaxID=2643866 RepID=UPI0022AB30D7|nr:MULTISPECIES: hypothetical protein [unclassified Modestobacter]MCZ2827037.1 hypothetical protein [Modestobacter sp. VKM Ac-2981]MCZ2855267.1 hypothetical protein [Modestobacter sp. VKM Ac-2982]
MSRRSTSRAVRGRVLGPVLGLALAASTIGAAGAASATAGPSTVVVAVADGLTDPIDLEPSPAADPDPTADVVDDGPTATVTDPWPLREEPVTVLGTGFSPEEKVTAELPARLRGQLGSGVAGPDGSLSLTVRAPMVLQAGAHEVLLRGTSGATASTSIQLRPLVEDQLTRLARWWPRG